MASAFFGTLCILRWNTIISYNSYREVDKKVSDFNSVHLQGHYEALKVLGY